MIDQAWLLWLLLLIVAVSVISFYLGKRSNQSALNAALAVGNLTNAVAAQSNAVMSSLDKYAAEAASLRASAERSTESTNARLERLEGAIFKLFEGFERAGLARSARAAPGRQVGEASPE